MLGADEPESRARRERPLRTPEPLAGWTVVIMIVASIMFGALGGFALGWSVAAWWTSQALGVLAAVSAGLKYRHRRSAAVRGAATGLIAAVAVLLVRARTSGADMVDFNPVSFPVVATVASAGLHVAGAALRRRVRPKAARRPL